MVGDNSNNYSTLKNDIIKLKNVEVETVKENGDWGIFSLILQAEKIGSNLVITLSDIICKALLLNDYYTALDIILLAEMKSKYSAILYEIILRYKGVNIPKFTIEELKELFGTKTKSYERYNNFKNKVLLVAKKEIEDITNLKLNYIEIKNGRKVEEIRIIISKKSKTFKNDKKVIEMKMPKPNVYEHTEIENIRAELYKKLTVLDFESLKNMNIFNELSNCETNEDINRFIEKYNL